MNFFRSEEHLRNWEGFEEKKREGVIALHSLMDLFSRSYFKNRTRSDWVSHIGEYMSDMLGALDTLEGTGHYWRLKPVEKLGVSIARKLGLM